MTPRRIPYALIAPATLFVCVMFVAPFLAVTVQAFTAHGEWSLAHFSTMVHHWKFGAAMRNTLMLALIVVPLQLIAALAMAQMLARVQKGRDLFLYIWTIPLGISDLAAGLVWLSLFEQSGYLNSLMMQLGLIDQPQTLLAFSNTGLMLLAVVLAEVWRATAIVLVILVSGMGLIPKEYNEAAEVFGAGAWAKFFRITLPLLRPSLQTALILRTLLAFEVFAVVAALAGTKFPVLMGETYVWQFDMQDSGIAAAYALVILGISIVCTLVYLRVLRVPKGATT